MLVLLGLPDVTGMAIPPDASPQDYAELAVVLGEQYERASAIFDELTASLLQMRTTAKVIVKTAIEAAGGSSLPSETLDITYERKYERKRDVAMLRANLPALGITQAEMQAAVYIKTVDVKGADPVSIEHVLRNGGKASWECDLRELDKMARKYGGGVKDVVDVATEKVAIGTPVLTIKKKAPPLKVVTGGKTS
jgi:hypothetical protein